MLESPRASASRWAPKRKRFNSNARSAESVETQSVVFDCGGSYVSCTVARMRTLPSHRLTAGPRVSALKREMSPSIRAMRA
eukprot:5675509-Pleurochrysis_carterae.AAC.1